MRIGIVGCGLIGQKRAPALCLLVVKMNQEIGIAHFRAFERQHVLKKRFWRQQPAALVAK